MSEDQQIVSNTGPLISLEKMNHGYEFIRRLYTTLIIPPAVLAEVAADQFEVPQAYLEHYEIVDLIEIREVTRHSQLPEMDRLHPGEIEAIQLALDLQLPLLIEETAGRRVAQQVGLRISGIAGQIIKAFRQDLLSATESRSHLGALFQTGRINRKIYDTLITVISTA